MKRILLACFVGLLLGLAIDFPDTAPASEEAALIPVARLADGALYEGDMLNGMLHGQGELVWPNGDRYQGTFVEGYFHGLGVLEMASGDLYRGSFKEGLFHGQGVYKTRDGDTYVGEFVEDEFTGRGQYSSENNGSYVGGFKNWDFFGEGTYTDNNGEYYRGEFGEEGIIHGQFVSPDGEHYQGDFDGWFYSGQGRLKTADGDVYEGQFENGYYHGQGTLTYAKPVDGVDQLSGEWQWGEIKGDQPNSPKASREKLTETVLYNQPGLLKNAWLNLKANDPDQIDLYFLGIAGDGTQGVFQREVSFVKDYFDQHFGTTGKSMVLLNDRHDVESQPLATVTSIERSLQVLADRMDAEQDILFVFLTSHGSSDFELSLKQQGLSLADLPAEKLGNMLKTLPVRWKVVVVSACYSGGFIPELADENTLVMTAAADDKTSFGCSDHNDFTYFGEALFRDALPVTDSFAAAFKHATGIIELREEQEGISPSEPQIHQGEAIQQQLLSWRQQKLTD